MASLDLRSVRTHSRRIAAAFALLAALVASLTIAGCSSNKPAAAPTRSNFASPEEAGEALVAAAKTADPAQLAQVLGAGSEPIYKSGDAAEDKAALASFVEKFDRMSRWVTMADGSRVLYIGADNYPFPVRLKKNAAGRWAFDTQSGLDEIVSRRIGRNELLAIDAVQAIANAEELYFKTGHNGNPPHQYSQLIISTPGKHDGLYWKAEGKDVSPLGNVEEFASATVSAAANGQPAVFDGYVIKILTAQGVNVNGGAKSYLVNGKLTGGFAVLAYPAKYQDSGIMTFLLGKGDVVYQKNLGASTATAAAAFDSYNPDNTWVEAE
jgi:hypothetical protein